MEVRAVVPDNHTLLLLVLAFIYVPVPSVCPFEAVFTGHFEGDDVPQQAGILGLFGQSV